MYLCEPRCSILILYLRVYKTNHCQQCGGYGFCLKQRLECTSPLVITASRHIIIDPRTLPLLTFACLEGTKTGIYQTRVLTYSGLESIPPPGIVHLSRGYVPDGSLGTIGIDFVFVRFKSVLPKVMFSLGLSRFCLRAVALCFLPLFCWPRPQSIRPQSRLVKWQDSQERFNC